MKDPHLLHKFYKCACGKSVCIQCSKPIVYNSLFFNREKCRDCAEEEVFRINTLLLWKLELVFPREKGKTCFTYKKFMTNPHSLTTYELEQLLDSGVLSISDRFK